MSIPFYKKISLLGPNLPHELCGSTMETSPTGKGVILIGGSKKENHNGSQNLLELQGDSIDSLKWSSLKQKITPRYDHVSFPITDDVHTKFTELMKSSEMATAGKKFGKGKTMSLHEFLAKEK